MPILPGNLKTIRSDTMSDTPDNGGSIGGTEIVSGELHNVFNDVSSGDRTTGAVRMRKLFHKITSQDRSVFLKARAILTKLPVDLSVDVTLFHTGDQHDRELEVKQQIEAYRVQGAKHQGILWETQYKGTPLISIFMDVAIGAPEVGDIMYLTQNNGTETQYVRVTSVDFREQTFPVGVNGDTKLTKVIVTLGLSERLNYTFVGAPVSKPQVDPATDFHESLLADSAQYYSTRPLSIDATDGDTVITADSVYSQLLPNSLREEAFIDIQPLSDRTAVVPSTFDSLTRSVTISLIAGVVLDLQTPIEYGSLSSTGGLVANSDGNTLVDGSGAVVANIDHKNGLVSFINETVLYGTKVLNYKPAILEVGQPFTLLLEVSNANLGNVYTINLAPSIVPGSVEVSYVSLGKWYTLYDDGNGNLTALRDGIGTGIINYTTLSVVLDLAALPDVNGGIIVSWIGYNDTKPLPSLVDTKAYVTMELPNYVNSTTQDMVVSWGSSSATLSGNTLTGDAEGTLVGKELQIIPDTLMAPNTDVTATVTAKSINPPANDPLHRNLMRETDPGVVPASNNGTVVTGTLANTKDIEAHSLFLRYVASVAVGEQWTYDGGNIPVAYRQAFTTISVVILDDGAGNLVFSHDRSTNVGTINYSTGAYSFTAVISRDALTIDSVHNQRPHFITDSQTTQLVGALRTKILPGDLTLLSGDTLNASWAVDMGNDPVVPAQIIIPEDFTHTQTVTELLFDLEVPTYGELGDNTLFTIGDRHYGVSDSGVLQYIVNLGDTPTPTGGILSDEHAVRLTDWGSGDNLVDLEVVSVSRGKALAVKDIVLRTVIAPNRPESFSIRGLTMDGTAFTVSSDANGVMSSTVVDGRIVDEYGLVRIEFNQLVQADSLTYNTTSQELITLPSGVIGLETVRLPADGRVRVFSTGNTVVIFNEAEVSDTYSNNSQLDLGRTDIKVLVITDDTGAVIPESAYTADLDAGLIDWGDLTNLTQPLTVLHRIENERVVESVQLTGDITLDRPLVGTFPKDTSFIASAIRYDDLVASVSTPFAQKTWTAVWSDSYIGELILPKYDDSGYPILVTNDSAQTDRYLIQFTNSTTVNVVSEATGVILEGASITTPISPINPSTGYPLFTITPDGWGGGWSSGNCVRFDVTGAYDNVWAVQSISKEDPTSTAPEALTACIELRGDINT